MTNDKKGAHIFHLSLIISHLAQRFLVLFLIFAFKIGRIGRTTKKDSKKRYHR